MPKAIYPWLWWAWLALVLVWGLRRFVKGNVAVRVIAATATGLALAVAVVFASPLGSTEDEIVWQPYSAKLLADTKARGAPYLLEFTADWCINCKVLEQTVYRDRRVVGAARAANALTLRADLTRPDERLQRYLREFGGAGLPFAVVLDGNGQPVKRLPDLFMADTLASTLHNATEE